MSIVIPAAIVVLIMVAATAVSVFDRRRTRRPVTDTPAWDATIRCTGINPATVFDSVFDDDELSVWLAVLKQSPTDPVDDESLVIDKPMPRRDNRGRFTKA